MKRKVGKRHSAEQIIRKLREADTMLAAGQTIGQVVQTLGQPERISRFGSAKVMREMWTYDGTGSAGLVVRLRKSLLSRSDQLVVEDVSRTSVLVTP